MNKKNLFNLKSVKNRIQTTLKKYQGYFIIIKIPVVSEVVYGRKVEYKFRKIKVSKKVEKILATNIRKISFKNE
tara:strand:+ start:463 stop:684 length:222 start_codon:yes stop_codon:yes gene_type:complete